LTVLFSTACSDSDKIYYEIAADEVHYHDTYRKGQEYYRTAYPVTQIVEGADAKTFRQINNEYGVDAENVFYKAGRLSNRDPASFRILKKQVTADKNGAYLKNKKIKNSDGPTFKFLSSIYAIDKNHVYYLPSNFYHTLQNVDLETFNIIEGSRNHAKDRKHVYYNDQILEGSNPNKLRVLNSYFSMDEKFVFYESKKLEKVDRSTFQILESGNSENYAAEDKNNYYMYPNKDNPYELRVIKKSD